MRRLKSTRNSLVLALLATFLLTIGTISAIKEPDEDLTTTTSTTATDSSIVFDEEVEAEKDAFNSENLKKKKNKNVFCSGVIKTGIVWPDAKAGTKSSAPCPKGAVGEQFWECSSEGRWVTENPNTVQCKSYWMKEWFNSMSHILSGDNDIKVETRYPPMVGGDLPGVIIFLEGVQASAETSRASKHQKFYNLVVFKVLKRIIRNPEIWENWDVVNRKEYESRLLACMKKAVTSKKEAQSTRDMGRTMASEKRIQSTPPSTMETIMILILFPCELLIAYILDPVLDAVLSQLKNINLPSLAIIKQCWKRVQSCFGRLHKKLSQLASDWISQLVIRDKNTETSATSSPQSEQPIGDYDERRENDEELSDWDTCEIPVLDRSSRIAELENELAELRMKEKYRVHLNQTIATAQSVPPGDIQTQPNAKIVFNAPYDNKHTYHIKVTNSSARRIGYGTKITNMKRLGVDPPRGVLDPKEVVLLAVSCDAFSFEQEDTNNDRITIEWTNTPDEAAKEFRREWFQGDGLVRRKNLPIEYNP